MAMNHHDKMISVWWLHGTTPALEYAVTGTEMGAHARAELDGQPA